MATNSKRPRKHRRQFHRRTQPGAPPGILVSDPSAPRPVVRVLAYGPAGCEEREIQDLQTIRPLLNRFPVTWVNVDGLGDVTLLHELGEMFGLHRLALEDVVHVHQRAKAEQYGDVLFVVADMPITNDPLGYEQISLFVGKNFLVSFQERPGGDCLDVVRLRLRTGFGRGRVDAPGHLMYAILDAIIDNYFPRLEALGDRLDALEEETVDRPSADLMQRIQDVKRELRMIRRAVWPLRDAITTLLRDESALVPPETRLYLRDCHDHTIQLLDLLENFREMAAGLTDVYFSSLSNNTNEIMRVLTLISTIFIPLTFIVGVYGMNFDTTASWWNMPELGWPFGYPLIWLIMIAIGAGQLIWFRKRGWLGSPKHLRRDAGTSDETQSFQNTPPPGNSASPGGGGR